MITGGTYDKSKGYFIAPTTIVTTNPKFRTMVEEIFGPVLTIYVYPDNQYSQTLELVDQTSEYALTGSIIATDRYAIQEANAKLMNAAGNFYINDKPTGAVVGQQPFGGARGSGTNDKAGAGLYDDRYVFHLGAFKYDMVNHGDVYIHNGLAALFPGSFQNLGDFTAPYTNQMNESWNLVEDLDTTITISNNAFIGFYTGVKTYRILSITDTSLLLQYSHFNGGLNWYLRLVPE